MTAAVIFTILIILALSFGWACLLTWAICFVLSLLGVTLAFSWKLVLAIWIITSLFSSVNANKKG